MKVKPWQRNKKPVLSVEAVEAVIGVASLSGRERARLAVDQLGEALRDPEFLESATASQVVAIEFALAGLEEAGLA